MLCFLAAIEFLILTFGLASSVTIPRPRFVNADHASFPWFAAGVESVCDAILIHPDILVTAAHCQGAFPSGLTMIDEEGQAFNRSVQFDQQVRHKNYLEAFYEGELGGYGGFYYLGWGSDIMLLKLSEPIYDVTPMDWNTDEGTLDGNETLTMIEGTSSDGLHETDMVYIVSFRCRTILEDYFEDNISPEASLAIDNGLSCTSPVRDIQRCADSGAPLFTQDDPPLLVGVASWGKANCDTGSPATFTRINTFDRWIRQQICEMSVDTPNYCDDYPPDAVPDTYVYNMVLEFTYDEKPWETTFLISQILTNGTLVNLFSGPTYVPNSGETRTSEFMLPPGEFYLQVFDLGGDGLWDSAGFQLSYRLGELGEPKIAVSSDSSSCPFVYTQIPFTLDEVPDAVATPAPTALSGCSPTSSGELLSLLFCMAILCPLIKTSL